MTIFVTGVAGQLGHDVVKELVKRSHKPIPSDVIIPDYLPPTLKPIMGIDLPYPFFVQLDITNKTAVMATIEHYKPDAIIHCAAWTNVDGAEDKQEIVHKINADGTRYIAEAAKAVDAKMIYISTDYVFDGQGTRPWQPDDKNYAPLNVYGQSKLDGEFAVVETLDRFFIVRIAWVFDLNGKNFIKTMINVGKTHDSVCVVDDQIGTPTYTFDLARLLVDIIETDKYGYYHATNDEGGEYISWADLAEEAYRIAGMDVKVNRVTTAEYGATIATRPFNSRLDKSKLEKAGFTPLPNWKDAVRRYVKEAGLIQAGLTDSRLRSLLTNLDDPISRKSAEQLLKNNNPKRG